MAKQTQITLLTEIGVGTLYSYGTGGLQGCKPDSNQIITKPIQPMGGRSGGSFGSGAGNYGNLSDCLKAMNDILGNGDNLPGQGIRRHHIRKQGVTLDMFNRDTIVVYSLETGLPDTSNFMPKDIIEYGLDDDIQDREEEYRKLQEILDKCRAKPGGCSKEEEDTILKEMNDVKNNTTPKTTRGDRNNRIIQGMRKITQQHYDLQQKLYDLADPNKTCHPCHFLTSTPMGNEFRFIDSDTDRTHTCPPDDPPWYYPWHKNTKWPDNVGRPIGPPPGAPINPPQPLYPPTERENHPIPAEWKKPIALPGY